MTKQLRPSHWFALDWLAGLLLAAAVIPAVANLYRHYDRHHRGFPEPPPAALALAVAIAVLLGLAVALRRRFPLLAGATVAASWLLLVSFDGEYSLATPVAGQLIVSATLILYLIAATRRQQTGFLLLAAALAGVTLATFGSSELQKNAVLAVIALLGGWAVGNAAGRHRDYGEQLREHQVQRLGSALVQERLRIARELHDVIAHSMSVVNVQAGYGHFVIDHSPAQAKGALATIQTVSRDAVQELRGLLDVLREDGSLAADGLRPAPSLADLGPLIARLAEAGVRVELRVTGAVRELPPGIELSAYRILQESLTNVVKHAGTSSASASLDYREDGLTIEITDTGVGGQVDGRGHGLAGMRERVQLYGGSLDVGPLPGRGFRVSASLPLTGAPR